MARRRRAATMWGAAFDAAAASVEMQQVMALRMAKIARGGEAGEAEARRMVDEKVTAALQAQQAAWIALMTGRGASIPSAAAAAYRRKVRANRRRLLKGG